MAINTVGELLYWFCANTAMAHAAVKAKANEYGRSQFMIRARLYAGLRKGTMLPGALAEDERLKMILPEACCYCGSRDSLSVDRLIPLRRAELIPARIWSEPADPATAQKELEICSNGWRIKANSLPSSFSAVTLSLPSTSAAIEA